MTPFRYLTLVVKDDERAFLTRDGRFERLLGPGRFSAHDPFQRLNAETVKVVRPGDPLQTESPSALTERIRLAFEARLESREPEAA